MAITLFIIAALTSIAGSICGIGGGVIIKPVLDAFNIMSVSAVSFLSGCTVLAMACISVAKSIKNKTAKIRKKTTLVLGMGAAIGGVAGKMIFSQIRYAAGNENLVGIVQSLVLVLITLATLFYMRAEKKGHIKTLNTENSVIGALIGFILGILSSFLGIGGGPINLAVLSYFFSMDTKEAATNSLCIILLSQIASLIQSLATASIPDINIMFLLAMVAGGFVGGLAGQECNKKMSSTQVGKLFNILLLIVVGVCIYNIYRFSVML